MVQQFEYRVSTPSTLSPGRGWHRRMKKRMTALVPRFAQNVVIDWAGQRRGRKLEGKQEYAELRILPQTLGWKR
jgi:hypothetical protein